MSGSGNQNNSENSARSLKQIQSMTDSQMNEIEQKLRMERESKLDIINQ